MIHVHIADDHVIVRRGVIQILSEDPEIFISGEASSGREALRLVRERRCDVLLLDISMPDGNGLEVLDELAKFTPRPKILILSMYPESQYARRALKSGADGYLTKDSLPEELLTAIHRVAVGRKYVSHRLAEELAGELAGEGGEDAPHKSLSQREYMVMCRLAAGKSVGEIGVEMALSVSTVSTYRSRILEKLGVKNTAEIIRYAIQHGLSE
jgi:DNA-binding NarL/FixJ family response regulator